VREAYQELKPVLETLVLAYPQYLKPEYFTLEAYLWAVELWYAYAMQVRYPSNAYCRARPVGTHNNRIGRNAMLGMPCRQSPCAVTAIVVAWFIQ
jgi:hypothetical protein